MSEPTDIQKLLAGVPFDLTITFKDDGEVAYKCFLPDDWAKIEARLRTADELEKASHDLETWAGCKCDVPGSACDCKFGPVLIRYHKARDAFLAARDTK